MRESHTEPLTGVIFDLQRFCLNDGPGIRTVFFFKGCPLRCVWCHNPESCLSEATLFFRSQKCAGCGLCAERCPNGVHLFLKAGHEVRFERCEHCGKCLSVCCYGALELSGRRVTVDEMAAMLKPDLPYFKNGGGVTFSGGEPMAQPEFVTAAAYRFKNEGVHVCLETCGYAKRESFEKIHPYVDLFLYDWKYTNPKKHKEYTGAVNGLILENLRYLSSLGKQIILRCPILPDINDSDEHFNGIAALARETPAIRAVELMPYHALGESKKPQIGMEGFPVKTPEREDIRRWLESLSSMGVPAKIG